MKAIVLVLCCVTLPALAAPAPWYKWKSKLDGKTACLKVSPGAGWTKDSGPYDDARCLPHSSSSSPSRPTAR